ncbi:unnamed protein product [Hapterophycus canaliculatus]
MQMCRGRSMAMVGMAMALRNANGFVGPAVQATAARYSAGGALRMTAGPTAASRPSVPVLDAEAAELKAERLWGMADARKPMVSPESTSGVVVEPKDQNQSPALRNSGNSPAAKASGVMEMDNFIEGEGEMSALRRYQYTEQLLADSDSEDIGDDGNEYYI